MLAESKAEAMKKLDGTSLESMLAAMEVRAIRRMLSRFRRRGRCHAYPCEALFVNPVMYVGKCLGASEGDGDF